MIDFFHDHPAITTIGVLSIVATAFVLACLRMAGLLSDEDDDYPAGGAV